ncbi:MAG: hypothetical protein EXR72_20195 [Myxococcales bacterium]|nr:hypothetical protein [Myxococcales bacterium]
MTTQAKVADSDLGKLLTIEEIERRYPDEWVVLVDTDWDGGKTTQGVLFAHDPRRRVVAEASRGLRRCAIFSTGKPVSPVLFWLTHGVRPWV